MIEMHVAATKYAVQVKDREMIAVRSSCSVETKALNRGLVGAD